MVKNCLIAKNKKRKWQVDFQKNFHTYWWCFISLYSRQLTVISHARFSSPLISSLLLQPVPVSYTGSQNKQSTVYGPKVTLIIHTPFIIRGPPGYTKT